MGKVDCHTSDYFNNNERLVEVLTNVKIQRIKEAEEQSMGNMCQAFEDYRQEGVEEGIRLQMKETNKAKRAAERANTRNKALQSDICEMKKEMKTLVKRIKELEKKPKLFVTMCRYIS